MPNLDELAEKAYEAFLQRLTGDGERPPFARPWAQVPPIVREAWKDAVGAVIVQVGNA